MEENQNPQRKIKRGGLARLDRIYIRRKLMDLSKGWKIEIPGIDIDHLMVSAEITCENAPMIGKGRWSIPQNIIKSKSFNLFVETEGNKATKKMKANKELNERSQTTNPQTIFTELKKQIIKEARKTEKALTPKTMQQIANLKDEHKATLNDMSLDTEDRLFKAGIIHNEIENITKITHLNKRNTTNMNNHLHGETMNKSWTSLGKRKKPRDLIRELKTEKINKHTNENLYKKDLQKQAELARDYHNKIQEIDMDKHTKEAREKALQEALENVTQKATDLQREDIGKDITEEEVSTVIKALTNGKAAGINGLTNEFWKNTIHRQEEKKKKAKKDNKELEGQKCLQ